MRLKKLATRRNLSIAVAAIALVLIGWFVQRDGKKLVRAAIDEVGMRNVEGFAADIRFAADESNVDPLLIAGVMYSESSGIPSAVSSANARGLMQLAMGSAQDAARKLGLPKPDAEDLLNDPSLNIRLGARHLAWLIKYEGEDLERVLACYNAGRTKVRRWIDEAGSWKAWRDERVGSGESQIFAYAHKVIDAMDEFERRGVILAE